MPPGPHPFPPAPGRRPGRRLRGALRALLPSLVLGAGPLAVGPAPSLARAQTIVPAGMPEAARESLARGQAAAQRAVAELAPLNLDHPLWREAYTAGERAAELAPDRPEPYRFLGQVYGQLEWHIRAWRAWRAYEEAGGDMDAAARRSALEAASWLAYNADANGRPEEAATYFEAVLRLDPDDDRARAQYAEALLATGRAGAAVAQLERLAAGDPAYAPLLARARDAERWGEAAAPFHAALGRLSAGDAEGAFAGFAAAVEAAPEWAEAQERAGRTALELGRAETAAAYLQAAIELGADTPDLRALRTRADSIAAYGEEAWAAYQEGTAAYRRGDLAAAAAGFERAVALAPELADAWAWRGRVAFETGGLDAALAAYERAAQLDPSQDYVFFLSEVERLIREREAEEALARERAEEAAAAEAAAEAARAAAERARREAEARAEREAEAARAEAARAEAEAQAREAEAARQAEAAREAEAAAEAGARAREAEAAARAPAPEPEPPVRAAPESPASPAGPDAPGGGGRTPAAALAASTGGPALVLVDREIRHDTVENGGSGAFTFLPAPAAARDDLLAPANYAGGTLHQRVQVLDAVGDATVRYQICLVPDDALTVRPGCSDPGRLSLTGPGTYEASQPVGALDGFEGIDWRNGLRDLMLVLRDERGSPIDDRYVLAATTDARAPLADYFPLRVRYTAVLVPRGGTFPGWPE